MKRLKGVGAPSMKLAFLMGLMFAGASLLPVTAFAQDAAKKQANQDKSAWIKVCEKSKVRLKKDEAPVEKQMCMTLQETINKYTGGTLVSAAIRKIEGVKEPRFLITVPLGVILPVGVELKIDDNKPIRIPFSICHQGGCVAETIAKEELLTQLMKGNKLVASPRDGLNGKIVSLPISLKGFAKAYEGKSFDMKKYVKNRRAISEAIFKKRVEMAKKLKAEQEAKKAKK